MFVVVGTIQFNLQRRHLGGWEGAVAPPKEKEKKEKKEKKERKKKETMNNVKLLHIKCCFLQFFNSPVALKNLKKIGPPEKVEMTRTPLNLRH